MQGVDPNDYYSEHPIENKIESRQLSQLVQFAPSQAKLSADEKQKLVTALRAVPPLAMDSIVVHLAADSRQARKEYILSLLRQNGFAKINTLFEPTDALKRGEAEVLINYSAVVSPNCPDWRMSPVTSYSNTWQANFKCATTVNFGAMIADPHDLVRGSGDVPMSTDRASQAVQDYNSGKDFMPGTLSAGSSSSSGGSGSSSAGSGASSAASGLNSAVSSGVGAAGGAGQ